LRCRFISIPEKTGGRKGEHKTAGGQGDGTGSHGHHRTGVVALAEQFSAARRKAGDACDEAGEAADEGRGGRGAAERRLVGHDGAGPGENHAAKHALRRGHVDEPPVPRVDLLDVPGRRAQRHGVLFGAAFRARLAVGRTGRRRWQVVGTARVGHDPRQLAAVRVGRGQKGGTRSGRHFRKLYDRTTMFLKLETFGNFNVCLRMHFGAARHTLNC
jgi:hypothetical protein